MQVSYTLHQCSPTQRIKVGRVSSFQIQKIPTDASTNRPICGSVVGGDWSGSEGECEEIRTLGNSD